MTEIEWITLGGVTLAVVSAVAAMVYSYAMLKRDVRAMHNCQRLTLRMVAKTGRVLKNHIAGEQKRLANIERKLGVDPE